MKKIPHIFLIVSVIAAMLLSACGAAAPVGTSAGSGKPQSSLVEFTGVIEAINGNQWTVNGQVITVDPAIIKDGSFTVGDTVKVEADVQSDGSVIVSRVEATDTDDNSNDANSNDVNANDDNVNDVNSNDDNVNDANSNDDNVNDANSNDDNVNDANSNDDDSNVNSNSNDDDSNDSNSNDDDGNDSSDDDSSDDDSSDDDSSDDSNSND